MSRSDRRLPKRIGKVGRWDTFWEQRKRKGNADRKEKRDNIYIRERQRGQKVLF